MEHLILLVLCFIFVGITAPDQEMGLAMGGGSLIFVVLLFIHWMTPDAVAVISALLDKGARFSSSLWSAFRMQRCGICAGPNRTPFRVSRNIAGDNLPPGKRLWPA